MASQSKSTNSNNNHRQSPRARVYLSEPAFIALVTAATEAYRRECYGVLLGDSRRGRFYVRAAFAYQTARRTFGSVELAEGRRRTVRQVLQAFPRYEYIGEFHSHAGYGDNTGNTALSEIDLVGVRPGECELVIAVRKPRLPTPWKVCADGSLSGAAGGHFVKMRAYLAAPLKNGNMRGQPVGIRCRYAVKTASSQRLLEERKAGAGP